MSADTAEARRILLTFRLSDEIFALDVARVHEIIDPLPQVRVPRANALAPGLINVRGSVVPVLDLHRSLGLPPPRRDADARMIVLDVPLSDSEEETVKIAVEADAVDQVAEIASSEIEPVPEIGIDWPPAFLEGVAKRDGGLVMLLRTETVFAPDRIAAHA